MEYLVLISFLFIASYTLAVCFKNKEIPYSISATFYSLEHKFWFALTMLATAGFLMPAILEVTDENYQFLAFLACVGVIMVGAAPNFKEGMEKKIHTTGAVMCLVFSQLLVFFTASWVLFLWVCYLAYTVIMMRKKWKGNLISAFILTKPMFWVEVFALASVYLTVIILYFINN